MDKIIWAFRNVLLEIESYGEAGDHDGKLDAIYEEVRALEARARALKLEDDQATQEQEKKS